MAGTRTLNSEPPRCTAYYYGDLERLKRSKNGPHDGAPDGDPDGVRDVDRDGARDDATDKPRVVNEIQVSPNELSEYLESNEVFYNDGAVREVPPLRDRHVRQWSLPEDPERSRPREETYSTAGTFPMPEPKEKEPLLAELEIVGRLPLTQLDSGSGVRRSRSWYLCCPNAGEEEPSRESSWRYSSLRPVTAPPMPNPRAFMMPEASRPEDVVALRAERDALARALCEVRARAAAAARAQDARLAELHGVIAELVRRRAEDKRAAAIPEDEEDTDRDGTDECESSTQPAGEPGADADRSRTDQNDTSSLLSPAELPTPQEPQPKDGRRRTSNSDYIGRSDSLPSDADDPDTEPNDQGLDSGQGLDIAAIGGERFDLQNHVDYETSLNLSERDSEPCVDTARCCRNARAGSCGAMDCVRADELSVTASPVGCAARRARLAARVRLRKTDDCVSSHLGNDEVKCWSPLAVSGAEAARLALGVAAQADLREALAAADNDVSAVAAALGLARARCARLEADARVLECALARATDTAHRLSVACGVHESTVVCLCGALRAADRALETYDVLLALAETAPAPAAELGPDQRGAAELVARRLLARLDAEADGAAVTLGEPLLSPGPWLEPRPNPQSSEGGAGGGLAWDEAMEARLRRHAARLKSETAALRAHRPPPQLFSRYDEEELPAPAQGRTSAADMETAVLVQEAMSAREERAAASAALAAERARVAALTAALARLRPPSAPPGPRHAQVTVECGTEGRRERERARRGPSETDL